MGKKLGHVLMGGAVLSKSLIKFSVDGRGCVPSLLFGLKPNYETGTQMHPSAENWIKDLLSMALPARARPSFPMPVSPIRKLP